MASKQRKVTDRRRQLAKVGQYRTITPKEGVYIHLRKKPSGELGGKYLRRTKEHAEEVHKPLREVLVGAYTRVNKEGELVLVRGYTRGQDFRVNKLKKMMENEKRKLEKVLKRGRYVK